MQKIGSAYVLNKLQEYETTADGSYGSYAEVKLKKMGKFVHCEFTVTGDIINRTDTIFLRNVPKELLPDKSVIQNFYSGSLDSYPNGQAHINIKEKDHSDTYDICIYFTTKTGVMQTISGNFVYCV